MTKNPFFFSSLTMSRNVPEVSASGRGANSQIAAGRWCSRRGRVVARKVEGVKVSEARMKPTPTGRGAEEGKERTVRALRSSVSRARRSVAVVSLGVGVWLGWWLALVGGEERFGLRRGRRTRRLGRKVEPAGYDSCWRVLLTW